MPKLTLALAACVAAIVCTTPSHPQAQPPSQEVKPKSDGMKCPMRESHSEMNARGEKGMGFSQTATVHHFLLRPDGGVIQVEAKDISDTSNRDSIRMHLTHVAQGFAQGNFAIPMFVHDTVPPGTNEMKRLREKIRYDFEEIPAGGRINIRTPDPSARAAIHAFLRFQIREHATGDPETVR
jgi:hypothetical protein